MEMGYWNDGSFYSPNQNFILIGSFVCPCTSSFSKYFSSNDKITNLIAFFRKKS